MGYRNKLRKVFYLYSDLKHIRCETYLSVHTFLKYVYMFKIKRNFLKFYKELIENIKVFFKNVIFLYNKITIKKNLFNNQKSFPYLMF